MLFIRELLILIVTMGFFVQNLTANDGKFENSTNIEAECAENGRICHDHNQCCSKFCEIVDGIQICGSSSDSILELEPSRETRSVTLTEYCTLDHELTLNCMDCCSKYCRYIDVRSYILTFCSPHPYAEDETQPSQATDDPESFWGRS
ncbi:uncharacterized protein LOC103580401 [Microplitis demolitor]|uniref:uncharacterized protein LOC103580401 n=1 Tax=Microplitis demolitor TaxID=69319 RepID=UPI0004CCF675|nr:uncharacterized protein LOC103580401 [Microplitis demolitor]